MKKKFVLLVLAVGSLQFLTAFASHKEKALWIETKEHGKLKSTLAVTEAIARNVLESDDSQVNFNDKDGRELVTKKMLRDVLDGRESSATAKDPDHDQEVTIYMKNLDIPGKVHENDRLVLATYKEGKKTFSITLPDIEVNAKDDESDDLVARSFGWKALLPFLAKNGGALYVKDEKEESEVWLYVE